MSWRFIEVSSQVPDEALRPCAPCPRRNDLRTNQRNELKGKNLMRIKCAISTMLIAAGLFCSSEMILAQSAPAVAPQQSMPAAPQMKKIGTVTTEKPKMEPALIVMNSRGATGRH
jgi:hypothetical protein